MSKITQYVRHLAVVAIATLLAQCAWAATPFAVWEGGFDQASGGFSATANGNEVGDTIKITQDKGVVIGTTASKLDNSTYIIHSTGLNLESESNQYLLTQHQNILGGGNGNASYNKVGVAIGPNGLCAGIWENAYYGSNATVQKSLTDGKILVINIQVNTGVFVYEITENEQGVRTLTQVYKCTALKQSNTHYMGFKLGGIYEKTSSTLVPATNWTITKLAVFNSTLSEADMLNYAFPSEKKDYVFGGETPAWMPSAPKNVKSGDTITINAPGATLNCDAPCTITVAAGASLTTSGDITIGNGQTTISGDLTVSSGTLTLMTKTNGGLNDNVVTIAKDATFKAGNNDMPYWSGNHSTTIKVYGTLDFANTRWTFAPGEKVIAYAGAEIKGAGDGEGAIDPNGKTDVVLELSGTEGEVTCSAPIRARSAAQILVPEGMTLNYSGTLGDGVGNNGNVLTKAGAGTMKITSNFNTTGGLKIAAGKVIVTDAVLRGGVQILEGAALELNSASEMNLPTIKDGTVGSVTIATGTINVQGQRKAVNVLDGAVAKIVVTTEEIAAGTITLPVPAEHAEVSDSKVAVVDVNGSTITVSKIEAGTEENTIVITLNANEPITKSCNLSDKITGKNGTIVVQGATGEAEAIAINVNCEIPEGMTLTVTGKADFTFVEGSSASAGTITLESGATATISGTINNTITLSDGATIVTSGAVTFGEGKKILRQNNNKNATLTIGVGSTVTLAAADSINTAVALNLYGTLDLGGNTVDFKSNPAEATYQLYVGATVANGMIVHQGGYNLDVAVLDSDSEDKVVHFTAALQTATSWNYVPAVFTTANGTSIEFTQDFTGISPVVVRGATKDVNIMNRGEYRVGTQRSLKGDVVVGANTTLSVTGGDTFEYETNKANLDVYGTINVNANRQTLSSSTQSWGAGVIKLHNGAQIIGAGASHKSTTVGLDIWNATTITVDGTVTISTPIYGEVARSVVSFVKADGAETAVVNMTANNTLNGGFKVGDGVVVDCGTDKATKYAVTLQGGTLKWAGAGDAHGQLVKSVTLEKDSRMECTTAGNQIGIGVNASAETTLNLAGNKLTMKAAQASDRIYFDKTSITSAGTLEIEQGKLFFHCATPVFPENTKLIIDSDATVEIAKELTDSVIAVDEIVYNGTVSPVTTDLATLKALKKYSGSGAYANLELADGVTIDVAEIPEGGVVASATNSLAINDISTIKLTIDGEETSDYTLSVNGTSVIAAPAEIAFTLTTLPEHAVAYIQINNGETTPIEGGTFTATPGDQFVVWFAPAEGYVGNTLSTGVVTVVYPMQTTEIQAPTAEQMNVRPVVAIAAVGEPSIPPEMQGFGSLAEAIAAGWYVFLTDAVTVDSTIVIDHSVVIDLQGHNVTGNGVRVFQVKNGIVEIDSMDADGNDVIPATISTIGSINPDSSVIRIGGDASTTPELTIDEGVTVTSAVCYGITAFGVGTQTLVVDGTVSTTGNRPAISGNGNASNGETTITINGTVSATAENAIYQPQAGTTTINGAVTGGIEAKAGAVTIKSGATVSARETTATHTANGDGCSTQGYAVAVVDNAGYKGGAVVTIEGGTITGPVAQVVDSEAKEANALTITGGAFTVDPSAYVADGYEATESEGVWTVSEKTGPTSWEEVDADTELSEVVNAETLASLEGSSVTAMDIAAWAAANGVEFSTTTTIPVNALIFYCAPDAIPTDVKAEADKALKQVAVDMDLLALMKEATEKGSVTIPAPEPNPYPLAVFKLVPSTLGDGVVTTAELFQLSIELK